MTVIETVVDGCIRAYVALRRQTLKWVIGEIKMSQLRGDNLVKVLKNAQIKYVKSDESMIRFHEIKQACSKIGFI